MWQRHSTTLGIRPFSGMFLSHAWPYWLLPFRIRCMGPRYHLTVYFRILWHDFWLCNTVTRWWCDCRKKRSHTDRIRWRHFSTSCHAQNRRYAEIDVMCQCLSLLFLVILSLQIMLLIPRGMRSMFNENWTVRRWEYVPVATGHTGIPLLFPTNHLYKFARWLLR